MKQILSAMTLAALAGLASLANSAVADELLARVRFAARKACIRNDERRQIFPGPNRKACIAESYANAVVAINAKRNVDLEAVAARHDEDANLRAALR